jgi:hypothetical protein
MSRFLDTRGRNSLAIAICDRCRCKVPHDDLRPDPDSGMMVCDNDCADEPDPWRLPMRPPDRIALSFVRPDTRLTFITTTDTEDEDVETPEDDGDFSADFNNDFS